MNPRRNSGRIGPVWSIGLLAGLVCVTACSSTSRHRVLTFLFDGVPTPGGAPAAPPPGGQTVLLTADGNPAQVVLRSDAPVKPPPPVIQSVHQPVRERQCSACHESAGRMQAAAQDATLCDQCHREQRLSEGWSHGPINLGTCIPCHVPHESQYPHLLDQPIPELCMVCHQEDMQRQTSYHEVANVDQCTQCHDPHRMY